MAILAITFHGQDAGATPGSIEQILPSAISHFGPFSPSNALNRRALPPCDSFNETRYVIISDRALVINVRRQPIWQTRAVCQAFVGRRTRKPGTYQKTRKLACK